MKKQVEEESVMVCLRREEAFGRSKGMADINQIATRLRLI